MMSGRFLPGDVLVHRDIHPTSWKTALIVGIDEGRPSWESGTGTRPASILLLVTGPVMLQRSFGWVVRNYERIE